MPFGCPFIKAPQNRRPPERRRCGKVIAQRRGSHEVATLPWVSGDRRRRNPDAGVGGAAGKMAGRSFGTCRCEEAVCPQVKCGTSLPAGIGTDRCGRSRAFPCDATPSAPVVRLRRFLKPGVALVALAYPRAISRPHLRCFGRGLASTSWAQRGDSRPRGGWPPWLSCGSAIRFHPGLHSFHSLTRGLSPGRTFGALEVVLRRSHWLSEAICCQPAGAYPE